MSRTRDWLEAAPLVREIEERGGIAGCQIGRLESPQLRRAYYRAKAAGRITWAAADTLAVQVMGRHPATIFGRAWWSL